MYGIYDERHGNLSCKFVKPVGLEAEVRYRFYHLLALDQIWTVAVHLLSQFEDAMEESHAEKYYWFILF